MYKNKLHCNDNEFKSSFDEHCYHYFVKEVIDVKKELTNTELKIIQKSEVGFKDIWTKEKQHIRDKLIIFLKANKLNATKKLQLIDIIKDIENVTYTHKERFILFYGLDKERKNIPEMARLYKCSTENIRVSIEKIKRKIIDLPNEKIESLRAIMKETK